MLLLGQKGNAEGIIFLLLCSGFNMPSVCGRFLYLSKHQKHIGSLGFTFDVNMCLFPSPEAWDWNEK